MSNCKDCLFWKPENEFNKKGVCGELSDKPFGAMDGLQMEVTKVITGPDFGCVHGRKKETLELFLNKEKRCIEGKCNFQPSSKIEMGFQVWVCSKCGNKKLSM